MLLRQKKHTTWNFDQDLAALRRNSYHNLAERFVTEVIISWRKLSVLLNQLQMRRKNMMYDVHYQFIAFENSLNAKKRLFLQKKLMIPFELNTHDYIQLNQLLKLINLVDSGGEANQVIVSGLVKVNGETELQKRKKLFPGDRVLFRGQETEIVK